MSSYAIEMKGVNFQSAIYKSEPLTLKLLSYKELLYIFSGSK